MKWTRLYGLEAIIANPSDVARFEGAVNRLERTVPLTDRVNELLVFQEEQNFDNARTYLESCGMAIERVDLLSLPIERTREEPLYADYAIVTPAGNAFLDLALSALFILNAAKPGAEPAPAYQQLQEHLIAVVDLEAASGEIGPHIDESAYAIDRQLAELADRIASAYGCSVKWLFT
ncbi:hypothetical protein [Cohnella soli]|uniref:Uncharacterized protein n=1 Tax=Cohnella soli TaxID=425005 RepID=A0ABW0HSF3_9BACL